MEKLTLRPGFLVCTDTRRYASSAIQARSHRLLIGRNPGNHVVLADAAAEPLHCKIYRKGKTIMIRNYSNANPIRLNGFKMYGEKPLADFDLIHVSVYQFTWHYFVPPLQRVRWIPADDDGDLPLDRIKAYLTCDAHGIVTIAYFSSGQLPPPFTLGYEDLMMDEEALVRLMTAKNLRLEEEQEKERYSLLKYAGEPNRRLLAITDPAHERKPEVVKEADSVPTICAECKQKSLEKASLVESVGECNKAEPAEEADGLQVDEEDQAREREAMFDHIDVPCEFGDVSDGIEFLEATYELDVDYAGSDVEMEAEKKEEKEDDSHGFNWEDYEMVYLEHGGNHYEPPKPIQPKELSEVDYSDEEQQCVLQQAYDALPPPPSAQQATDYVRLLLSALDQDCANQEKLEQDEKQESDFEQVYLSETDTCTLPPMLDWDPLK
uniref:FHA domain-containing protein n=1 Tax=Anopheles coluzzii TaxID=1518534 RepID=A0A6E8V8D4_ANOCL